MLTSIRGLRAASFLVGTAVLATPALAAAEEAPAADSVIETVSQADALIAAETAAAEVDLSDLALVRAAMPVDSFKTSNAEGEESEITLSGNVALVSDYRFRGVSFTDGDPALQGGIDLAHSSGFYVGTWASSITGGGPYGELELDLYAGWSGDISDGVTFDIGLLYYVYPTGNFPGFETDYFEPYASLGFSLGPVGATVGVAYAWDQDSLGSSDNLYLYTDFEYGIPDTPLSFTAHLGYTDGVFAPPLLSGTGDDSGIDWGLGASWAITDSLSLGVNYVDTEGPAIEDFTDAGFFVTLGYSM